MAVHRDRDDLWWSGHAWEDYLYWQSNDPKKVDVITRLIEIIRREPWTGLGKPEPLKGSYKGWWSRRIDQEHRLVYRLFDMPRPPGKDTRESITVIQISQCRFHYD
ncbi:Txe/YoeB family addiction module toxin [Dyella sp.]|uniref:Txe/YoeB family addiction module toxin n=1 Tax=Dyella sp. TaxID=1869338 RepID=UPI002B47026A|nr:Txe/YoeB family addiction module toxin [Dyella sp.]HKT27719.1 Txe/YoeB family addiction module toxin [Dyella sp.]